MENNDLQRAIDEIANGASNGGVGDFEDFQDQMGVLPMPPLNSMEGDVMQDMDSLPSVDGAPNTPVTNDNIEQIRENALRELLPLMEKTHANPIQKYSLYRDAILSLHDTSAINGAYNAAKQIEDESKRAEALLDIVNIIDRM